MQFLFLKESPAKDYQTALERARYGDAMLERKYGPEWDLMIDVDRLDIASTTDCIIGQITRKSGVAFWMLNTRLGVDSGLGSGAILDAIDIVMRAFFIRIRPLDRSFKLLTAAWKQVLEERRMRRLEENVVAVTAARPAVTASPARERSLAT